MNSSVLWGLASGLAFLLAIGFFRFVLPKLANQWRTLFSDANSLLAPRVAKPASPIELAPLQTQEVSQQVLAPSIAPEVKRHAVRTISTAILVVVWPVFTFVLPFTAFFPPLLFVYIAYPVIWYYSGVFYTSALAEGKPNLLMASAPLLFLLVILVPLLLIAAVLTAFGK
jgi:hypothetical protein